MTGHTDTINTCAFSYTEKCFVTGSNDRTIKTWDTVKGFCTKTLAATSSVNTLQMLPNESNFVTGHLDGSLRFWSLKNEKKTHEIKDYHTDSITSVSITPNGRYLLSFSRDHSIKLLDMISYQNIATFEHDQLLNANNSQRACISSNGKYGVAGSKNGAVVIMQLNPQNIELEEIYTEHVASVITCEWQPDGQKFASYDTAGTLIIWE